MLVDLDEAVQKLMQFDLLALEQVHDAFYPSIHRYVEFRLQQTSQVNSITKQVFINLVETLRNRAKTIDDLPRWLFTSCAELVDQQISDHYSIDIRNQSNPPETDAANDEITWLKQLVQKSLYGLPFEYQHILALRFCETRTVDEVARLAGKSIMDVKTIQFHALTALRELLEKEP